MSELVITRQFNEQTGQLDFFSQGQATNPRVNAAKVNLSRGGDRRYSLSDLQAHNGTGANWKDGRSIHTQEAFEAYVARVERDIAAAIAEASKPAGFSTSPTVLAVVNGGLKDGSLAATAPSPDFEDEEEDEEEEDDGCCRAA